MRKIFVFINLVLIAVSSFATPLLTQEADSAYMRGNYPQAISLYKEATETYGTSVTLLYNMGNAYYMADDYGNAMLCYLRARKLDPSSSLVNLNLKYLEEKVKDANRGELKGKKLKIEEDEPTFFQSMHKTITKDISSNTWAIWGGICFVVLIGCILLYMFMDNVLLRKIGFFGALACLGLCIIFMICAFAGAYEFDHSEEGVILTYKVPLLTEPADTNSDASNAVLTRGSKVRIIAEEADADGNVTWYKVRLNSDFIGWVKAEDLEII